MCLQRGQGGGFDTNCCCCCCCCLVVVVVFAIVLDYNCVKSRVSSGLEKLSGFLKSKSIKIEELFQKATTTTIRNLPGLRERRFDLRVALFAHRGKRSQRTFPQAARADHGLLGALQRGENVLNCQRLPKIARDCQRLPDCRDNDVAGADHHHAANGHARTRGGQLDFGLRGARISCPNHILAGGVVVSLFC